MAKVYSDITDKINDLMNDTNFTNNRTAETLRAINEALEDINIGNTEEDNGMDIEVGYDFQLKTTNVSFTSGTNQYTFTTLGIADSDFKFSNDLRVNSTRDTFFLEVSPNDWFRRQGVLGLTAKEYTIHSNAGTSSLWINYATTSTLNWEYYVNHMVADSDGTSRSNIFSDSTVTRILLIPDRHWLAVPYLAAAKLAFQRMGDQSQIPLMFKSEGIKRLKRMMNSIGKIRKSPSQRAKVRSEFFGPFHRIGTE